MNTSKFIGSTLLVIGTMVGAGMLALPMVSASAGFFWSSILLIAMWLVAIVTGLLIVEVNLSLPSQHSSFSSMSEATFGTIGKIITWICTLCFLYSMLVAYIIGESDIMVNYFNSAFNINISNIWVATSFTVILGIAVFWSTAAADYVNRGLMSVKGLLLIVTLILLVPHIDLAKLTTHGGLAQVKYLWIAVPAFLSCYCYQFVIPSLRMYVGDNPKQLRLIIIIGSTIAMLIYLWWLASILGVVPLQGENSVTALSQTKGASVGMFVQLIIAIVNSKWVAGAINGFTIIAMTTSFIGVSLGLFDFLADAMKRQNSRSGRFQVALVTFIPPLLFAIFFPDGFIKAINYIAIPVAMLCVIFPALMAYKFRKSTALSSPYRVKGGNGLLWLIMFVGAMAMVFSIMCIFNLLPGLSQG